MKKYVLLSLIVFFLFIAGPVMGLIMAVSQ